ncbi:MAG: DUF1918 domain-containing protein [Pseudoclavibacter sp.]
MNINVGDRIVIRGAQVGQGDRPGTVLEVHGSDGAPPYLINFDDGHEELVFPGPDFGPAR